MSITDFGRAPCGRAVERIEISGGGLTAAFLTWGATLQDLRLAGTPFPLVLGSDRFAPYLDSLLYSGALVGRFSNRLGGGRFAIDGRTYQTDRNSLGRHTLHGGQEGSGQMLWRIEDHGPDRLTLVLVVPDGHMGFPGDLEVRAHISLPGEGTLALSVVANCNRPTPCSFAQHSYFNLDDSAEITGHQLQIHAGHYLPVDTDLIPTGEIADVTGTRFDFRTARAVGHSGYDHNFCTSFARGELRPVAELSSPASGLHLTVETTEPGLQFYDGAHLDIREGLNGRLHGSKSGIALEAQAWPDAPNFPGAPETILRPGTPLRQELRYVFRRD
ncbi:aldose epimerase family protein [Poseidonocella sp. HB161398]|uniref:aldose epimerase family protein n=1 Tax=Poseidonocella sp. HB161398 TaxID=2320855 RepID=UPI001107CC9C|nr:aldose epimerase family protein [Poseidonocella sp. HB161398]